MRSRLLLLALLATALVGIGPAPAQAVVRTLTTSYTCDAGSYGGGTSAVTVKVDLPRRVKKGEPVPGRRITVKIVVPEDLVQTMRDYSVDAVSGTSDDATYRVGTKKYPIKNLTLPETPVPAEGAMTLKGAGRAAGFTPRELGRFPVKVPKSFTADATAHGSVLGDVGVTIGCTLEAGAPAKLATLRVVR